MSLRASHAGAVEQYSVDRLLDWPSEAMAWLSSALLACFLRGVLGLSPQVLKHSGGGMRKLWQDALTLGRMPCCMGGISLEGSIQLLEKSLLSARLKPSTLARFSNSVRFSITTASELLKKHPPVPHLPARVSPPCSNDSEYTVEHVGRTHAF